MTNHVARLYAVVLAIVVFFLTWAGIAAEPWNTRQTVAAAVSPQAVALDRRAKRLERKRLRVQAMLDRRFAEYRSQLRKRRRLLAQAAAAAAAAAAAPSVGPSVGTTSLPPVTATKSS